MPPTPDETGRPGDPEGPIRTCVGCRLAAPASALLRVRLVEGQLVCDRSASGRGAWIGPSSDCLERAVKRHALPRALRSDIDTTAIEELRKIWPSVTVGAHQLPFGCPERG